MAVKPFLRWAGSKRKQLPRLGQFWRDHGLRYVEPFAGSACFFFAIEPQRALLADINSELIRTYVAVRDHACEIYNRLLRIPRRRDTYYSLRCQDPGNFKQIDRAVRFLFLNRNCFNGIYRTNLQGCFNVPFSDSRTGNFVTEAEFTAAAQLLKRADLRAWDFARTLESAGDGDFVYMDPPFAVGSRRVFREYGAKAFGLDDLARLGSYLPGLHERGAKFVLSYAYCRQSSELARAWHSVRIRVRRHVAGFVASRRLSYEHIITNVALHTTST